MGVYGASDAGAKAQGYLTFGPPVGLPDLPTSGLSAPGKRIKETTPPQQSD